MNFRQRSGPLVRNHRLVSGFREPRRKASRSDAAEALRFSGEDDLIPQRWPPWVASPAADEYLVAVR